MDIDTILRDATARPWEWSFFSKPDGTDIKSNVDVAETTSHSAMQSERAELWGACHPTKDAEDRNIVICYTGNGPTSKVNSSLIVLAVNSYEAQREVIGQLVEALNSLANEASGFRSMADISRHGATNMRCLGDRVTQAFEALVAAKKVMP